MSADSPFRAPDVVREPDIVRRHGPESRAAGLGRRLFWLVVAAGFCALLGFNLVFFPPEFLFGGILGLGAVVAILARPYLGLILYTFVFMVRPAEMIPALDPLRLERVIGVITLGAMALEMYRRDGRLYLDGTRMTRLVGLIVVVFFLSAPFSFWSGRSMDRVVDFLKIAAFYIMIVQLCSTRGRFQGFVCVFLLLLGYLGVDSLRAYLTGNLMFAQGIERAIGATSSGGDPNSLGATLGTAVPLGLLLLGVARNGFVKLAIVAGLFVCLYVVSITGSRSAMLGLLTALFVLWTMSRRKLLFALLGLAGLILAFFLLPESYQTRYGTITSGELDTSSQLRIETWKAGLQMLLDRPLLGVGVGAFGAAHNIYSGSWLESHSLYIQVPSEVGLIGAVVFGAFFIHLVGLNRRVVRIMREKHPGWRFEVAVLNGMFASLCFLFVFSGFGHTMLRYTWYVYAAMVLVAYRLALDLPGSGSGDAPPVVGGGDALKDDLREPIAG